MTPSGQPSWRQPARQTRGFDKGSKGITKGAGKGTVFVPPHAPGNPTNSGRGRAKGKPGVQCFRCGRDHHVSECPDRCWIPPCYGAYAPGYHDPNCQFARNAVSAGRTLPASRGTQHAWAAQENAEQAHFAAMDYHPGSAAYGFQD